MPTNAHANTPPKSFACRHVKRGKKHSKRPRKNGATSSETTSRPTSRSNAIAHGRYSVTLERIPKGWAWEMTMNGEYIAHGARMGTKADVIEHLRSAIDRLNNPARPTSHAGSA